MISASGIGDLLVGDFEHAMAFYDVLLQALQLIISTVTTQGDRLIELPWP